MLELFANARTHYQNGCNHRGSPNFNPVAISGIFLCQNFTEGGSSVQSNACNVYLDSIVVHCQQQCAVELLCPTIYSHYMTDQCSVLLLDISRQSRSFFAVNGTTI